MGIKLVLASTSCVCFNVLMPKKEVAVKTGYQTSVKITVLNCERCFSKRVLKSDVQAYFDEIKIGSIATPFYVNETDICSNCEHKDRIKAEIAADKSLLDTAQQLLIEG